MATAVSVTVPRPRDGQAGFSLVALVASITIMLILMGMAMPSWKYVMQNEREQELYFRGDQIAAAIERFQKKNGNAVPPSLEILVQGRFLRTAYKDPMTKHGRWKFIRPGEVLLPGGTGNLPGKPSEVSPSAPPGGQSGGPFIGVASTSTDKSLRMMNGREQYDLWAFVAGQPRVLGRTQVPIPGGRLPGSPGPGGSPPPGGGERREGPKQ